MTTPDLGLMRQMDNAQEGYRAAPGGVLSVDVERARAVVAQLREVADEVAAISRGMAFARIDAPASDEVSRNAAAQATTMMLSARTYLRRWQEDLVAGIGALEQQISDYEHTDRAAIDRGARA